VYEVRLFWKINWASQVKYLRILFHNNLCFKNHIKDTIRRATGRRGALYPVLNKKSPILTKTKLILYTLYIKLLLTYAGPVWASSISKSNWTNLKAIQNLCLHIITKQPPFVSNYTIGNSADVLTIKETIKQNTQNLFHKNQHSSHIFIQKLGRETDTEIIKIFKKTRLFVWVQN